MTLTPPPKLFNDDDTILESATIATENTSLLSKYSTIPPDSPTSPPLSSDLPIDEEDTTPLPKLQIFLLCCARVIEPMAFFGIFPYVNKMILEIGQEQKGGMEESDVGFYSGIIESLFSITQMLLMIQWGRAADRIGRKPVLIYSLCGVSLSISMFGFSKRIWQMILFRCCAGIFSGTIVTIRTLITENSTKRTQARAFSLFAFSGNIGIVLGPFIGGSLSSPAEQYPNVFGNIKFFKTFPYSLPSLFIGALAVISTIICGLFIKETLTRKDKNTSTVSPPLNTWEVIKSPGVPIVLFLYGYASLLGLAYTAVTPVMWFTSTELGGYGWSPLQISIMLGVVGVSQALWLLFAFPPLQHRFGSGGVLRGCLFSWPIFFATFPFGNFLLRREYYTAFWIMTPLVLFIGSGVSMSFTLNDISPSQQSLATLNGVSLTLTAAIRAITPALFTSLFAVGAKTQFLDGYLIWVVMVLIAMVGSVAVRFLPEKAEGKVKR